MIIWLTGQPGSGKTTIARELGEAGLVDFIIDGDDLRNLMPNPGYDAAGRHTNIDRAQSIAAYLDDRSYNVIVALVAPYREQREEFKGLHNVLEIYLYYDPDTVTRGREGYWVRDYEPPINDFVGIDTGNHDLESTLRLVYRAISAFPRRARMADRPTAP